MNTAQIRNIAIGAVVGYAGGYIAGKFVKPEYKQHLAIGLAIVGGIVGYNMKVDAPAAAMAPVPAAPAVAAA
jgi:hypothetical protein